MVRAGEEIPAVPRMLAPKPVRYQHFDGLPDELFPGVA
jgi:hypothetical protein